MLHEPLNRPTLRRRDLAAGSLWTIPVVIFAAPAPAASTSPLVFPVIKSSCKYPGNSTPGCNKGYHFELAWTNQVPYYVTVDITSATAKATTGGASTTMPLIRHILYDFDGSTVVSTAEPFALGPTITNQPAAMDALDASNSANIASVATPRHTSMVRPSSTSMPAAGWIWPSSASVSSTRRGTSTSRCSAG